MVAMNLASAMVALWNVSPRMPTATQAAPLGQFLEGVDHLTGCLPHDTTFFISMSEGHHRTGRRAITKKARFESTAGFTELLSLLCQNHTAAFGDKLSLNLVLI